MVSFSVKILKFIDLCILTHSCISGTKSTQLWHEFFNVLFNSTC
jgi:hypothetical protein